MDYKPLMLTLCLEEDSILVSKAILEALQNPKHIQMLINEDRKMLMLQSCTVNDKEAVVIPDEYYLQFEMSGHALLRRIRRLTHWTDTQPRVIYGVFVPDHHAVVFNLMTARRAQLQTPPDRPN